MARTTLGLTSTVRSSGVLFSPSAANVDGHSIDNSSEQVFVYVNNGSGASITVSFPIPKTIDGCAVADKTVTIGAGANRMIGPFPKGIYNQTGDLLHVNFSSVTSVTVAAVKFGSNVY